MRRADPRQAAEALAEALGGSAAWEDAHTWRVRIPARGVEITVRSGPTWVSRAGATGMPEIVLRRSPGLGGPIPDNHAAYGPDGYGPHFKCRLDPAVAEALQRLPSWLPGRLAALDDPTLQIEPYELTTRARSARIRDVEETIALLEAVLAHLQARPDPG